MKQGVWKTVFVGMSGGVDSSVAAALLKKQRYNVVGVHLRCFSTRGGSAFGGNFDECAAEKDVEDARRVAEHLGIPFYVFDFEEEYKKRVVDYMIEGYRAGITPNPDVMCNREIKFGLFFERAMKLGADYVATGHYVRPKRQLTTDTKQLTAKKFNRQMSDVKCQMFSARDTSKDQSYFLWTLTQEQLRHCLFPIGDYLKSEVRAIARKLQLPTADKKDSQGICFLGKVSIVDFLRQYIKEKPGAIFTTQGKKVGEHKGIYFYTIGQRHLGAKYRVVSHEYRVSGRGKKRDQDQKPFYVAEKDVKTNTLIVAEKDDPALFRKEVALTDVHFINPLLHNTCYSIPVLARVRYRQPLFKATLVCGKLNVKNCKLIFDSPQKFVAEGQSAVFYGRDLPALPDRQAGGRQVLGGGVIV